MAGAQVLTRDGFDLSRHPLSELSLGDLGWVQIANFVPTGLLAISFALGARRVLYPGRGGPFRAENRRVPDFRPSAAGPHPRHRRRGATAMPHVGNHPKMCPQRPPRQHPPPGGGR